ncbi:hypothetical protein COV19_01730 [Candidatus Woesearchaeota archaeon CG10_big_fil_rev_8_21_14_0_10_44_13]|nr:MAG: hypothetical protein COV19_01730 [Candidatus Woesearchaeota archaeon CG10_big_fil_rev_8_21_14_0_10_44_13]
MFQKKDRFQCRNCGYCCTLIVLLKKEDIERIKKLGYDDSDFVETDALGRKRIRMKNYYCHFLGLHKGETFCRIYHARPQVCRDYPFTKKGAQECFPPRLFDDEMFRKLEPKEMKQKAAGKK